MLRILHIERSTQNPSEDSRFDLIDAGRYGEEPGFAHTRRSLTADDLERLLVIEGLSPESIRGAFRDLAQTGSAQVEAPPRVGPRIVRAWFDTLLNPAISALSIELGLLLRRRWTFSFSARALELIQPLGQRFHGANLDQFREMNSLAASEFDAHDALAGELQRAVTALFDALVSDKKFIDLCDSLLAPESLRTVGIADVSEVFGAYRPELRYSLLAEYVVNNTGELPAHYATAKLWNRHRDAFQKCLTSLPEVSERVPVTLAAAERLANANRALDKLLKSLRQQLSLHHDVPIEPANAA